MIECPEHEALPLWNALPADDPRRQHAESCPRCRSWWLEFQDFEAAESTLDERTIAAALGATRPATSPRPSLRPRRWLVAACIPLLAGGLWWASSFRPTEEVRWRGTPVTSERGPVVRYDGSQIVLDDLPADARNLRWVWIGEDLTEVGSVPIDPSARQADGTLRLEPGPAPTGVSYWQVEWESASGDLGSTPLEPVPAP